MSRNGTGTYTLPAGTNPVIDGTIIDANWANGTLNDVASAITQSLPRDGQAPMSGALKLADGTVGSPALTWNSDNTTGLFRPAASVLGFTAGGVEQARFVTGNLLLGTVTNNGSKLQVQGNTTLSGNLTVAGTTIFSSTTPVNFASTGVFSSYEAIRLTNGAGYISAYNADGSARQGYLQFTTNGAASLVVEGASTFIQLITPGGSLRLLQGGTTQASGLISGQAGAVINGNVAATSFSGDGQNISNVKFSNLINGPLSANWNNTATFGGDLVAGLMAWRNYGNGHVIFDASKSLSPTGAAVNAINPTNNWSPTFPTLMGWNGSATYGVRVDSARVADTVAATTFGRVNTIGISNGSYGSISVSGSTNGYAGINFPDAAQTLMVTNGSSGMYRNNNTWDWRFDGDILAVGRVPASSIIGTLPSSGSATLAAKASTLAQGGGDGIAMTFNYAGQGGQPTWLWGTVNGTTTNVYNPSNFNVNYATTSGTSSACSGNAATATYATSAGSASSATTAGSASSASTASVASTLAGGASGSNFNFLWSDPGGQATYYMGSTNGSDVRVYSTAALSVGYATTAGSVSGNAATASQVQNLPNRGDNANYPVTWNNGGSVSPMYSCAAVYINSATGTLGATNLYASNDVTIRSDARVKTEIQVIEDALSKVKRLRGVTYTRTDKGANAGRHAGVLAQEVREVLPEVVKEDVEGMLHVAYGNMISLLIEAVKELSDKVDTLEAK